MKQKTVLCDSSSLISLTNSCFIDLLYFFTKRFSTQFIIAPSVEKEIIERPLSISMKAYELSAMRMKKAIDDRALSEVNQDTLDKAKEIMDLANNMLFARSKPIHLVDIGEADIIALAKATDSDVILMDERTTRMLIEAPFRLKEHMESEMGITVMLNKRSFDDFKRIVEGMKVIRSSEIVSIAYKAGYFSTFQNPGKMLEASLYSLKYGGCSIGFNEIDQILDELNA
jgi:predicted nucleic acid-binding protein